MPLPYESPSSFTRKGKLFFITSLEKHRDLSALLGEIEFVFKNPQTREVVLYFKERFRPFPNIVVPLACAIDHLRRNGRIVRVNETFDELEETGYMSPRAVTPDELPEMSPGGLVWKYETSEDVYNLLAATIDHLSYRLEWEHGTLHALEWSLYEVLDNVFQHAGAHAGFFMFQIQQQQRRLSYCVADQGCGIFHSLSASVHKPASPLDAITLAVRKGVTRNPNSNMGNGLWGATEIVARSKGQITISSGGAALYFNRGTGHAQSVPKVLVLDHNAPGTFIDAQIDASVEVQMTEMFDDRSSPVNLRVETLEDEYGAVRVVVKNMRLGAGTRQSGNFARIYTANLLNQTVAPLIIDFSGVGIVSSSFADEFIAKLYLQLGADEFNDRIRLYGMNETNNVIVRSVLSQRIGGV
jgi:hypothetical protein